MSSTTVVHIIDHMGLGGVQTLLYAMLPELPAYGFRPLVLNLRKPTELSQKLEAAGVPVHSLGLPKWSPRQLARLTAELRRIQPAIVHTHLTVGNLLGRLAAMIAGVPAIVLEDQISVSQEVFGTPSPVVLAYRLIEPALAPRTTRYLCPSQAVLEASWSARGWPAERCRVRHNAVDCVRFAPVDSRPAARAALGLPNRTSITTLGRFVAQKRIADVVEVARRVVPQCPDVQFLIAGGGPEESVIRAAIRAAGLEEHVLLLGRRGDSERILAASEIYLSVSAGEVLSIAILEAMASGCVVVATRAGGTAEQVFPGLNGCLTPVGDVEGLAQALLGLLRDEDRRESYSQAGRCLARERFSIAAVAADQAAIYRELKR